MSNGYTPINDAATYNPGLDERRGSGNTNDLRGKILRIHVQDDGSYTIPSGNLFPSVRAKTRPEIFVMGLRNPYRMAVDKATGAVMWGDYGPDAGNADAEPRADGLRRVGHHHQRHEQRLAVLHR